MAATVLPPNAFAEVQTFTATHTYVLSDHDSKDDARQRCLLEAKRKILEQAGVYIESASEVKNFDLTKDTITSFAVAVMQVKDTKEEVGFQQGHMTMTLKLTAQVDLAEVRKQLAARQLVAGVRDDVAAQKERLQSLEAQVKAMMHRQQGGQFSEPAAGSAPIYKDLQKWHAQAAEGHATDEVFLGILYHKGVGVPQDYAEAKKWYERAAIQGNVNAQSLLGMLYYFGEGIPQDYGKARQWFEKAAAQGHVSIQYALGYALGEMYASGKGVSQDYSKARQWYEKAAAQGDAEAQTNLGLLYNFGQGVAEDYVIARHWCEEAANQGAAAGQNNLGRLYYLGQGVPKDYKLAQQWFEKGAAQGDGASQVYLGLLYDSGEGDVPQNYVKAHMWYSLAVTNSENDKQRNSAVEMRVWIERRMTPTQVAEAQRLAQQCHAQQFKGC